MCCEHGHVTTVLFQFQLVIAMVHVQVRKLGGTIEFVYNIIQCRRNCEHAWDGFIGFPHLHIQLYFINRPFQSYFNRGNPTGRFVYFLNYVIGHKFLQLHLQFRPYTKRYPSVSLCHALYCRVDVQIHLHHFHLSNTLEGQHTLSLVCL